jgi:hypothetical protein
MAPLSTRVRRPRAAVFIASVLLLATAGCNTLGQGSSLQISGMSQVTLLELRELLNDFAGRFTARVKAAAMHIVENTDDLQIRRRTAHWKLLAVTACRTSVHDQRPFAGLADVWVFSIQMRRYFEEGDGASIFGEWTSIAADASREIEKDITDVASKVLTPEQHARAQSAATDFATANPIAGPFARQSARAQLVRGSDSSSLRWLTTLPLAPFTGFLDEHAKAIQEFAVVAGEFTEVARYTPEIARWQLELLLYDVEERLSVKTAIESIRTLSESSRSIAESAEKLPEELHRELAGVLEDVESKQAGLRETLKEARATIEAFEAPLERGERIARSAETVIASWKEAAERSEDALRVFQEVVAVFTPAEEPAAAAPGPAPGAERESATDTATASAATAEEEDGFDIKDYTQTAERTRAAAVELRALTRELRELLDSERTASLPAKLAGWGLLAAFGFFALLLAYRVAARRLARNEGKR